MSKRHSKRLSGRRVPSEQDITAALDGARGDGEIRPGGYEDMHDRLPVHIEPSGGYDPMADVARVADRLREERHDAIAEKGAEIAQTLLNREAFRPEIEVPSLRHWLNHSSVMRPAAIASSAVTHRANQGEYSRARRLGRQMPPLTLHPNLPMELTDGVNLHFDLGDVNDPEVSAALNEDGSLSVAELRFADGTIAKGLWDLEQSEGSEASGARMEQILAEGPVQMRATLPNGRVIPVLATPRKKEGEMPIGAGDFPVNWHEERERSKLHPENMLLAEDNTCPRCLGPIWLDEYADRVAREDYTGALSRADNLHEVCGRCGNEEAFETMAGRVTPVEEWPIPAEKLNRDRKRPAGGPRETWRQVRGIDRERRSTAPTPKEVPDLRQHLLEKWADDGVFLKALGAMRGGGVAHLEQNELPLEFDAVYHRLLLREAGLWWVRKEICELVQAAASTVPEDLRAEEVKLPLGQDFGMLVFEKPYVGTDVANGDIVQVDVVCWGRAKAHQGTIPCISLSMYRYFDFPNGLNGPDLEAAVASGAIWDANFRRFLTNDGRQSAWLTGGAWTYVGRTDWPMLDTVEGFREFDQARLMPTARQRVSMIEDRRFFAALCVLVDHKLSESELEHPARETWRRLERAGVPREKAKEVSTVRIVRLRELKRKPGETQGEHEKRQVAWSHRWFSSGHMGWRRCGPGRTERRLVYVSPSIKGPAGLPLVVKERVNVFVR